MEYFARKARMKLELLILTLPSRTTFLEQLQTILDFQCAGKDAGYRVMVHDREAIAVGDAKQKMKEKSTGEYICFFDDDDLPAGDYIDRILPLCDRDYVGFRVQCYQEFEPKLATYHSLQYAGWSEDLTGYYRQISHINPMRRELSLAIPIEGELREDSGEDFRWAMKMSEAGIVQTEHYIEDVMYHYYPRALEDSDDEKDAMDPRRLGEIYRLYGQELRALLGLEFYIPPPPPSQFGHCPICKSTAVGLAGGMRHCNQCGASWAP
jgi:hypothetical protein